MVHSLGFRLAWIPLILAGIAHGAGPANPHLQKAEQQIEAIEYEKAAKSLQAAWKTPGNDLDTVLLILERQGLIAATLNQPDAATDFFKTFIVIAPNRPLSREYAPRVMTRFYEAKAWVGRKGPLKLEPLPDTLADGLVTEVGIAVKADPLKLGREVVFRHKDAAGAVKTTRAKLSSDTAKLKVSAPKVEWWAELLAERGAVVGRVGSEITPILSPPPPPPVEIKHIPAAPPPVVVVAPPEPDKPINKRVFAYPLLGASVLSAGAGLYFGVQSSTARAQFTGAARDESGTVVGISQRRAAELQSQASNGATNANILFAASVGLCAGGVGLYLLGGDAAVAPAPGGVVVSGRLP